MDIYVTYDGAAQLLGVSTAKARDLAKRLGWKISKREVRQGHGRKPYLFLREEVVRSLTQVREVRR